jgi:AcrR family transcriptional regulator
VSPRPNVEEARRRQILEAACEAIAERGFAAVRISDVAAKANTSTGTVHYYFDNRQDVLRQALRFAFEQSLSRQLMELGKLRSPRRRLVRLIELNLPGADQVTQEWIIWMEFWLEAVHHPEMRPVNEDLYGRWRKVVADIIVAGQAAGDFKSDADPDSLANRFVALMDGLAIQVLLHSSEMTVTKMRRVLGDFVTNDLSESAVGRRGRLDNKLTDTSTMWPRAVADGRLET